MNGTSTITSLLIVCVVMISAVNVMQTKRLGGLNDRVTELETKKITTHPVSPIVETKLAAVVDPIGLKYPAARKALNLLRYHESRNDAYAVGDGGRARGWLQQHKGHWERGCEYLKVDWSYPESTTDLYRCEQIALANWLRDAKEHLQSGNVNELLRRFRLPFAPYRKDNDDYLANVLKGNLNE